MTNTSLNILILKLNGDIDGIDRQYEDRDFKSADFAYAYFRDDLKGQENCNPDINIEMKGKDEQSSSTKVSRRKQ